MSPGPTTTPSHPILGSSLMAANTRAFPWETTPLGPIESWSPSLASAVNFLLASPVSTILMAGPQLITLYNDAYIPTLLERHPAALGMRGNVLWADAWEAVGHQIEAVSATGESFKFDNVLIPVERDGVLTDTWFTYSFSPIFEAADSSIAGVLCMAQDVTQSNRTAAAILQTEKLAAVGRLAASIAHEINNPLESVTNLLFLSRGSTDFDEVQGFLATADRELRRVSVITTQTLRFYKQASGARLVDAAELFDGVLTIHQGRLVNSGIDVQRRLRVTQRIECFEGEIRQVLTNLVGNAIDAMPRGGHLHVRSRATHHWRTGKRGIALTVADGGVGMPPEVLRRLGEAFYTTKGIGGTGLGLWVSKEIVTRHNGALHVRSSQKAERSGTVFTLFLPFDAAQR